MGFPQAGYRLLRRASLRGNAAARFRLKGIRSRTGVWSTPPRGTGGSVGVYSPHLWREHSVSNTDADSRQRRTSYVGGSRRLSRVSPGNWDRDLHPKRHETVEGTNGIRPEGGLRALSSMVVAACLPCAGTPTGVTHRAMNGFPKRCPRCRSRDLRDILYGTPDNPSW
jgi:hypothetical protein